MYQNEKACYSRPGKDTTHDYEAGFDDAQKLQNLRGKLLKSAEAIKQTFEIATGLQTHQSKVYGSEMVCAAEYTRLSSICTQLQSHRRVLVALIDLQSGATNLVSM